MKLGLRQLVSSSPSHLHLHLHLHLYVCLKLRLRLHLRVHLHTCTFTPSPCSHALPHALCLVPRLLTRGDLEFADTKPDGGTCERRSHNTSARRHCWTAHGTFNLILYFNVHTFDCHSSLVIQHEVFVSWVSDVHHMKRMHRISSQNVRTRHQSAHNPRYSPQEVHNRQTRIGRPSVEEQDSQNRRRDRQSRRRICQSDNHP